MDKMELKEICDDFGLSEKVRNFIEKGKKIENTAYLNQFRVISEFILGAKIESVVDKMIASNEKLATSNEKYSNRMFWLTIALVFVGVVQAIATIVQVFIQWLQISSLTF